MTSPARKPYTPAYLTRLPARTVEQYRAMSAQALAARTASLAGMVYSRRNMTTLELDLWELVQDLRNGRI